MRTPNLDIYEGMPDRTLINAKNVGVIFGYKPPSSITDLYSNGYIPKPFTRIRKGMGKCRRPGTFWRLGDLRKLKVT